MPHSVTAHHDGYAPIIHERTLHLEPGVLTVQDAVIGEGRPLVEIFFHVHPDVRIEGDLTVRHPGGAVLRLHPPATTAVSVQDTLWSPEFGRQIPNRTIALRAHAALPATFNTRIELLP
jgi:uncharacterized heparinase superfamily protein